MSFASHAAWLPRTNRPPHDPRCLPLNPRAGWFIASSDQIATDASGYLTLQPLPGSRRRLTEASGSFGGLQYPDFLVQAGDGSLFLLDRAAARLKKFDPCDCRFIEIPFTGGSGSGIRQFDDPRAIAICGDNLLVADRGNHRLMVYSLLGYLVRGVWYPPSDQISQPWTPVDATVGPDRKVLVADPANGCIHVFNFAGRWLKGIQGVGAVSHIAVDRHNRLYVVIDETSPVSVWQLPTGERLDTLPQWNELEESFDLPEFEIDAEGNVDLGRLCQLYQTGSVEQAEPRWFDETGSFIKGYAPAPIRYPLKGRFYSQALDSHLYRCQWDRAALKLSLPRGTRLRIWSYAAETELTAKQVEALPDALWMTDQSVCAADPDKDDRRFTDWDCLLRSEPGRFLWLRIEFFSDGLASPRLCDLQLDFPRISLARYLPAVFSAEPVSADFTDRFLAVFDRGFRQIEHRIDHLAALFDPMSAPAEAGKKDFLTWLASWIGVTLDRQLPLPLRRRLVKQSGQLFRCRGTHGGLRKMLDLYLGFDSRRCNTTAECGPCGTKPPPAWKPPRLILEHYVLRRWLWVGCSRLGEQAMLWGQKIVNRSQLSGPMVDGNAQLGVTQLNTRQDPLRDPFHVYAHRFSVFLPAWVGRIDSYRNALARLIEAEKPAHTVAQITYVEPRFRVGIQSMIGYDAVIGCYPQGVTLDQSRLGKASVLSSEDREPSRLRIGDSTRMN